MKNTAFAVMACVVIISGLIAGCGPIVTGSGVPDTLSYDYEDFKRLEIHNGFRVEVVSSPTYDIEITVDDNIAEYLEVDKIGDKLRIQLDMGRNYRSTILRAKIMMPDIGKIELSGGSSGDISGFGSNDDFSAELSGGSRLEGDITSGKAKLELSGGSRIELQGSAEDIDINSSGGSKVLLEDFPVVNADIEISGGGSADMDISGVVNANLSGGSRVRYTGEPKMGDFDLSGGSTISRK